MRFWLAMTSVIALALLPAAAEAGMRQSAGVKVFHVQGAGMRHSARANVFRIHHLRHAQFGRFHRGTRNFADLAPFLGSDFPFLGSDFVDGGIARPVAEVAPPSDVPFPAALPRLRPRPGDERATVEVEKGVTVIRGPGSRHILP